MLSKIENFIWLNQIYQQSQRDKERTILNFQGEENLRTVRNPFYEGYQGILFFFKSLSSIFWKILATIKFILNTVYILLKNDRQFSGK